METARLWKLFENLESVKTRIKKAAERAGRDPDSVELVAVTKYAADEDVAALLEKNALAHMGESRVQDAVKKFLLPEFSTPAGKPARHMIGHLQSNKAGKAAEIFDWVDSIDSLRTARALDRRAAELAKTIPVLIQLKLSAGAAQNGTGLEEAPVLLAEIKKLQNLSPRGYMGIAPVSADPEDLRPVFRQVKRIFDRDFPDTCKEKYYLSLGMSGDFETAVEEGSNLPRIGSLIFQ